MSSNINGVNETVPRPSSSKVVSPDVQQIKKIKTALSILLDPAFKISDDTVLEKLFSHLTQQYSKVDGKSKLSELAIFIPWLCLVKRHWPKMKSGVRAFSLKIAGFIASQPNGFFTLYESEVLKVLSSFVKEDTRKDLTVLLGYAYLLQCLISHSSGWHWVMETGLWNDMVDLALGCQSIYASREGCRFTGVLIVTLEKSDLALCHQILDVAFAPLRQGVACALQSSEASTSSAVQVQVPTEGTAPRNVVIASLKLASEVVLHLLNEKLPPERIKATIERYKLEEWAWWKLHEESTDVEMITTSSKLLCLLHMTTISRNEKGEVTYTIMRNLTLLALKHLHIAIMKHFFTLVLDVCVEYQTLWHNYGGEITYTEEDLQHGVFSIENNLIITQAMPTFICMKVTRVMESDVMDLFAEKIFSLSCTETQRVCYAYRDCLRESTDRSIEALCFQGILSFSRVTHVVKKEQATMAFQCMMHTLKEFVPEEVSDISADCIVARRHAQSLVTRFPTILSALLDGLIKYLSNFQFNWRDSLETVCILNFLQGLIVNPNISSLLCAKALQLTKLVIIKFIPPNLALLVDTLQGSSIGDLGKQLFKKIHDIHWEVRDSALEVLEAIASIADAKFPAFQTLLLENDLPRVVAIMVTGDSEYYVRASAMACLVEMVKIQNIWETSLYDQKLIDSLLKILLQDTEGIVRYNATLLLTAIYKHQSIPGPMLERVYDTMFHTTVCDLHWEVKIGSLEFWDAVIQNTQTQEGMIDGAFPDVTFSRQAKKIVILNPPEICNRLLRLLRHLSSVGCLYSLWKSLQDECDLEVVKKSVTIIKSVMSLLNKYDILSKINKDKSKVIEVVYHNASTSFPREESSDEKTDEEDSREASALKELKVQQPSSDAIIEQIVNEEDINLLSSKVHFGKLNISVIPLKPRIQLPPEEFLERVSSINLDAFLSEKSKWVNSGSDNFGSLLDDILSAYSSKQLDHNSIDCY